MSDILTRLRRTAAALTFGGVAVSGAVATSRAAASPNAAGGAAAPAIDGIRCDRAEGSVFHIHQHLAVFVHGKALAIPSDVGRPLDATCLYWLHTHTSDGIIHVESPVFRTFTLGNFFDVWGEPLSPAAVASARVRKGELRAYVDGEPYRGNPRRIELAQHTDIVLEAGAPYSKPAPFSDWQGQ